MASFGQFQLRRPKRIPPQTTQPAHMPAPVGGLNALDPASAMSPLDCNVLYNMVPGTAGLEVRPGYEEWVTGCTGTGGVRSILSFKGSAADGTKDRLFACTGTDIWDCTTSTATPTSGLTFATSNTGTGHGKATAFVNTAAAHYLLYCDETNGYHVYTESTDTWATQALTGVTAANLPFCMAWKNRVWFVEKNTATGWYLPLGAFSGTVQPFYFGQKFKYGGDLVGLYNWTVDGGAGADDYLVAISRGGDIVIYQGTDPSSVNTFALKGIWYAGGIPTATRRVATDYGGDLLILTNTGVIPLSQLVAGALVRDPNIYATRKVGPIFNSYIQSVGGTIGWDLRVHPTAKGLMIIMPPNASVYRQFFMGASTKGWSLWNGLDMQCAETWNGALYFGDSAGVVHVNEGNVDAIARGGVTTNATDIEWSLVTSFQNLGSSRRKRLQLIKPWFVTTGTVPAWRAEARYDFNMAEAGSPGTATQTGSVWGTGLWGSATWGAGAATAGAYSGGAGMGANVAVALRGTSRAQTTLVGFDLAYDSGGVL